MQDYVHELELCLAALRSRPDPAVEKRMQQLVFEAMRFKGHHQRIRLDSPDTAGDPRPAQRAQGGAQAGVERSFVPAHLLVSRCKCMTVPVSALCVFNCPLYFMCQGLGRHLAHTRLPVHSTRPAITEMVHRMPLVAHGCCMHASSEVSKLSLSLRL